MTDKERTHTPLNEIAEEKIIFPAQCSCGHLYFERYVFLEPNKNGEIGFAYCGFCRTKRMVTKINEKDKKMI